MKRTLVGIGYLVLSPFVWGFLLLVLSGFRESYFKFVGDLFVIELMGLVISVIVSIKRRLFPAKPQSSTPGRRAPWWLTEEIEEPQIGFGALKKEIDHKRKSR